MNEEQAQAWLEDRGWWHSAAGDRLRGFVNLLLDEADRQNLISTGSREALWARHIVDSAQLLPLTKGENSNGLWVDLGTGAGLPGLVIACIRPYPILMIEARPLRVAFLQRCIDVLSLDHAQVQCAKVEKVKLVQSAAIISARAYAPMERLLPSAIHLSDSSTTWLLPKGRNAQMELEFVQRDWQAAFHVEQSVTDSESAIVILSDVRKRSQGSSGSKSGKSARFRPHMERR